MVLMYVLGLDGWFARLSSNEICESRRSKGVSKSTIARGETVWLTQAQLCELYQSSKANVSEHIKNIFEEGELEEASTVRNFRTVQIEGGRTVNRSLTYYNLDIHSDWFLCMRTWRRGLVCHTILLKRRSGEGLFLIGIAMVKCG